MTARYTHTVVEGLEVSCQTAAKQNSHVLVTIQSLILKQDQFKLYIIKE